MIDEEELVNPYEGDEDLLFVEEDVQEEKTELIARPWRVLIVDDDRDVHMLTRMVFRGITFEDRTIEFISAYSGEECIKLLGDNTDAAMILLDVVMETPDAGFNAIRRIRDELDNQLIRIVLHTGQPGLAPEESVILEYDVNDYVAKTEPFSRLLTAVITGLRTFRDLQMRRQFNLAAALEEHLFTRKFPEFTAYELHARSQSALQTGGDFFEIQSISDHEVVVAIGDVSGKGLPASLYVAATLSMLRAQIECYRNVGRGDLLRPSSILKTLNRLLLKTLQRGKFVTMFVGVLDVRTHQFCYASAGHCSAHLVHDEGQLDILAGGGMVCGLCGTPFDNMLKEYCVTIPEGSYLMLNTDGLTEATNRAGEMYGDERYRQKMKEVRRKMNARESISLMWDDVMTHLNHGDLSDDCTMLVVRRR
jgi:phosphoserine phosphatase RsbU/P